MPLRIEKELSDLYQILSDPAIQENRSPEDEKIIEKALKTLGELQTRGKLTQNDLTLFHDLDERLHLGKVSVILERIFLNVVHENKERSEKIGLKIAFYCDVDCRDHNGAIHQRISLAVDQKIPFVTTRSLLRYKKDPKEFITPLIYQISMKKEEW